MLPRQSMFFVFLLAGGGFGSIVQAGGMEQSNWRLSIDVDYLGVGNANSTLPNSSNICAKLIAQNGGGGGPCSVTTRAYGAEGLRLKALHEYEGIEVGPSIGYLNGGPGVGVTTVRGTGAPIQMSVFSSANTMRFLGELRKKWPLSESLGARMGAGVGVAVENKTLNSTGSTIASNVSVYSGYSSMGWLTWEFSPAVVYKSISLGVRYVGFARGSAVPWNTFGGFFGVDF